MPSSLADWWPCPTRPQVFHRGSVRPGILVIAVGTERGTLGKCVSPMRMRFGAAEGFGDAATGRSCDPRGQIVRREPADLVDFAARCRCAGLPLLDPIDQHMVAGKLHVVGMERDQDRAPDDA